jgi:hypothetical protein
VCHVEDLSTGKAIVAPLTQLPVLKDCSISLGKLQIPGLVELANITRLQTKGILSKDVKHVVKPFRYQDLPIEIKFMILENTDLVPAFGEIS